MRAQVPRAQRLGRGQWRVPAGAALRFAMDLSARFGGRFSSPRAWAGFVVVGADTRPLAPRATNPMLPSAGSVRRAGSEGASAETPASPSAPVADATSPPSSPSVPS